MAATRSLRSRARPSLLAAVVVAGAAGACAAAGAGGVSAPAPAAPSPFSIDDFGAIAGVDSRAAALANGAALAAALTAANASDPAVAPREALVPAGRVYAFLPATPSFDGVVNVTLLLEGTLNVTTANFSAPGGAGYPGYPNPWHVLHFTGGVGVSVVSRTGRGLVNGRGNAWWWATILTGAPRMNLLVCDGCARSELTGVSFLNAPQYNVAFWDTAGLLVQGVTVMVDIEDQLDVYRYVGALPAPAPAAELPPRGGAESQAARVGAVLRAAGVVGPTAPAHAADARAAARRTPAEVRAARRAALPAALSAQPWFDEAWRVTPPVPMVWALNTDGIDFTGSDVVVRNCSITNFDDTVCPKPTAPPCTRNVLIEDIAVTYGVGISMGSVPPDVGGNCIDGVLVRRAVFHSALKTIYVKPNPAKSDPAATGLISNITYEDVRSYDPIWWPIWIGPQQQQQPGDPVGTGCSFVYPLDNTTCATDPQVSVRNVTLRRVDVYNGNSPGVLLANASNPATGLVFDAVVHHNGTGWPVGADYLCGFVSGVATGGTSPVPPCFTTA